MASERNDNDKLTATEERIASAVVESIRKMYDELSMMGDRIDALCEEHGWSLASYIKLKPALIALAQDLIGIENTLNKETEK